MEIKILGTRGEVEPSTLKHSRQSGILLDKKIMFDLGEEEFLKERPKYIFITHLHPDHAFFVRRKERFKTKIPIYAPEKHRNCKNIRIARKLNKILDYKITAIPTTHSKYVKSRAYLIERKGKKVLYTGDMIWIRKNYHHLLKNLDLVITEGSFMRRGGMVRRDKKTGKIYGHNGIPDLIRLFKKFTHQIIFVHFGSWLYKDIAKARKNLEELGKENKICIGAGYDGMTLDL